MNEFEKTSYARFLGGGRRALDSSKTFAGKDETFNQEIVVITTDRDHHNR